MGLTGFNRRRRQLAEQQKAMEEASKATPPSSYDATEKKPKLRKREDDGKAGDGDE